MKRLSAHALRVRVDVAAALGLRDPDLPNWRQIRAQQRRELHRILPVLWTTNLLNAVALTGVLWPAVPHTQVLAWLVAVLALVSLIVRPVRRDEADERPRRVPQAGAAARSFLCGLLWALPAVLFSGHVGLEHEAAICLVLAGMIASAPFTLATIPLGMILFVSPIAIALSAMMARTGSPLLQLLPIVYAATVLTGGLTAARTTLQRRWAELALDQEAGIVSLLLREYGGNGADWLWEIDVRKRLCDVTPRFAQAIGQPVTALRERSIISLFAEGWLGTGGPPPELRALLDMLDGRQSFKDHLLPVLISGEQRWWRLSAVPRYEPDGSFAGFRGVGSDVTEQRRNLDRIDRLARADGLTDIDNRLGFTDKLRSAIEQANGAGTACALILLDLDHFKAVNDSYGHPAGDKLLRAAAGRLVGVVGRDGVCGRLGGDEFAILIDDAADPDHTDALCCRVQHALSEPFEIEGHFLEISASIGTATAPADGDALDVLMRHADLALYGAKALGRGTHRHFTIALLEEAERRLAIERALRHALDRGELRLAYQPVLSIDGRRLVAFEALLRWDHPAMGAIMPEEFIPIAERARLLGAIGDWVLHTGCREASRWPADVRLSVNLRAAQLLDPRLPMTLRSAMQLARLAPARLELEIAEPALLHGGEAIAAAVGRIQATGVRLLLDDFGAGLRAVRRASFGAVKVARELLDDITRPDVAPLADMRAVIAMADALGVEVIVKGAATREQQALAGHLGCGLVQDDIYAPPLPADDAAALARALGGMPGRRAVA